MFITILIIFLLCIAVGLFQIVFNQVETKPYKNNYHALLIKLNKNPDDMELKNKALVAGQNYYNKIRTYKTNTFKGAPASVSAINNMIVMDDKILYEDMDRLI